jgi:NO-binding membrane sensor protein with MHYT domain
VLGSLLGLVCTSRGREAETPRRRFGWLTLAAISIGGTGIWLMHFLAMIGFSVDDTEVRFNVPLTIFSAVLAIAVVGVGLAILGTKKLKIYRVVLGGLFTGLGVAGMHYTGMAAMRVDGTVGYKPSLVILSLVIAVVAATAALWFTVIAHNYWTITGAALIMGVAVNGMHYTGMYAAEVKLDHSHMAASGVDVASALPIIAGLAGIVVIILLYAALSIPTEEERMVPVPVPTGGAEPSFWTPRTPVDQPGAVRPTWTEPWAEAQQEPLPTQPAPEQWAPEQRTSHRAPAPTTNGAHRATDFFSKAGQGDSR